jgi:hypothetical protein
MNINELAAEITKQEGKLHSATHGDVREIFSLLSDFAFKHPVKFLCLFYKNGSRRAKVKR